jgi:small subunit ribosomal protein S21
LTLGGRSGINPLFDLPIIVIDEGESIESALRRFKRRVQQEAIIKEIKKHSLYFKPGERKRMKEAQARKCMRRRKSMLGQNTLSHRLKDDRLSLPVKMSPP